MRSGYTKFKETEWEIMIIAHGKTKEEAIEIFEKHAADMKTSGYDCSCHGGGPNREGNGGDFMKVVNAPRPHPLDNEEIRRLHTILAERA